MALRARGPSEKGCSNFQSIRSCRICCPLFYNKHLSVLRYGSIFNQFILISVAGHWNWLVYPLFPFPFLVLSLWIFHFDINFFWNFAEYFLSFSFEWHGILPLKKKNWIADASCLASLLSSASNFNLHQKKYPDCKIEIKN